MIGSLPSTSPAEGGEDKDMSGRYEMNNGRMQNAKIILHLLVENFGIECETFCMILGLVNYYLQISRVDADIHSLTAYITSGTEVQMALIIPHTDIGYPPKCFSDYPLSNSS